MDDIKTKIVECKYCGGDGTVAVKHPMWGSPMCPEDEIVIECNECAGSGAVEIDDED